ncbi:hypothetical protein HWC66_gp79 [Gordonia phage Chikenjars]|uniref:Uncharacterized protein n=1 Tax=Gordonia phage Chikenjars TaxID=2601686 RepID=A0A5J6D988_9CAUD|nr:hypothetical protein HWC66_gp79 [Gordonia phage Chikenjars]QEQ94382.1 hypothetical protein SEA_CHIKENJARS_79 [Gordonia phage Chikenjars]
MEYTLLIVERIFGEKETKDETIIEGYTNHRGLMTVLEKYSRLDDHAKGKFCDDLGSTGSAEHSGVPYSIYVTGPVDSMIKTLGSHGDKSS